MAKAAEPIIALSSVPKGNAQPRLRRVPQSITTLPPAGPSNQRGGSGRVGSSRLCRPRSAGGLIPARDRNARLARCRPALLLTRNGKRAESRLLLLPMWDRRKRRVVAAPHPPDGRGLTRGPAPSSCSSRALLACRAGLGRCWLGAAAAAALGRRRAARALPRADRPARARPDPARAAARARLTRARAPLPGDRSRRPRHRRGGLSGGARQGRHPPDPPSSLPPSPTSRPPR